MKLCNCSCVCVCVFCMRCTCHMVHSVLNNRIELQQIRRMIASSSIEISGWIYIYFASAYFQCVCELGARTRRTIGGVHLGKCVYMNVGNGITCNRFYYLSMNLMQNYPIASLQNVMLITLSVGIHNQ